MNSCSYYLQENCEVTNWVAILCSTELFLDLSSLRNNSVPQSMEKEESNVEYEIRDALDATNESQQMFEEATQREAGTFFVILGSCLLLGSGDHFDDPETMRSGLPMDWWCWLPQ